MKVSPSDSSKIQFTPTLPKLQTVKPTEQAPLNQWQSRGTWPQGLVNQIYNILEDHMVEELAVQADPSMRQVFAKEDVKKLAAFSKDIKTTDKFDRRIMEASTWQDVIKGIMFCKLGKSAALPTAMFTEKTVKLGDKTLNLEQMSQDLHHAMNSFILVGDTPMAECAGKDIPLPTKLQMRGDTKLGATRLNNFFEKYEWVAELAPAQEMEELCNKMGVPQGIFAPASKKPTGFELN
jgi:hypothetical protein